MQNEEEVHDNANFCRYRPLVVTHLLLWAGPHTCRRSQSHSPALSSADRSQRSHQLQPHTHSGPDCLSAQQDGSSVTTRTDSGLTARLPGGTRVRPALVSHRPRLCSSPPGLELLPAHIFRLLLKWCGYEKNNKHVFFSRDFIYWSSHM